MLDKPIPWAIFCGIGLMIALIGASFSSISMLGTGFLCAICNYIVAYNHQVKYVTLANTLRAIYEYVEYHNEHVVISFENGEHKVEFYEN